MKRRAEFLVEKRDGRREWLRATKLARSIHLALSASGASEPWRAIDLAEAVLGALRLRRVERGQGGDDGTLSTLEISDAVQHALIATGFGAAAWSFTRVGAERRRRGALLSLDRQSDPTAGPGDDSRVVPPAPAWPRFPGS
jgi:hypothetical protein